MGQHFSFRGTIGPVDERVSVISSKTGAEYQIKKREERENMKRQEPGRVREESNDM